MIKNDYRLKTKNKFEFDENFLQMLYAQFLILVVIIYFG